MINSKRNSSNKYMSGMGNQAALSTSLGESSGVRGMNKKKSYVLYSFNDVPDC